MRDHAFVILDECDLRVHDFEEEFDLRFRKQLEFRLSRRLSHQSMGKGKTRLQHLATAAAINLERVSDWLGGIGRERTRRSAFARVMQPQTA